LCDVSVCVSVRQASLRLFNPREFNQLLSGAAADSPSGAGAGGFAPLDVDDMRLHAKYSGGYR
jgi:ubiquitin-protein ligase E3 C